MDASNAAYTDYKYLQLVCPCCKSPVHLIGEQERAGHSQIAPKSKEITSVVECVVAAHFCHVKDVTEAQARQCELRVSRFKQVDLKRFETRARYQMLKKFQRHFWDYFSLSKHIYDDNEMTIYIIDGLRQVNPEIPERCIHDKLRDVRQVFVDSFKQNQSLLKQVASRVLLVSQNAFTGKDRSEQDEALYQELRVSESWLEKVEITMHKVIVQETITFLCARNSYHLLCRLFLYGISMRKSCVFDYQWDITKVDELQSLVEQITGAVITGLCFTKWADNFTSLGQQ